MISLILKLYGNPYICTSNWCCDFHLHNSRDASCLLLEIKEIFNWILGISHICALVTELNDEREIFTHDVAAPHFWNKMQWSLPRCFLILDYIPHLIRCSNIRWLRFSLLWTIYFILVIIYFFAPPNIVFIVGTAVRLPLPDLDVRNKRTLLAPDSSGLQFSIDWQSLKCALIKIFQNWWARTKIFYTHGLELIADLWLTNFDPLLGIYHPEPQKPFVHEMHEIFGLFESGRLSRNQFVSYEYLHAVQTAHKATRNPRTILLTSTN